MPKTPESPLENPRAKHARRPSNPRRTSSDKRQARAEAIKDGITSSSGHGFKGQTAATMSDSEGLGDVTGMFEDSSMSKDARNTAGHEPFTTGVQAIDVRDESLPDGNTEEISEERNSGLGGDGSSETLPGPPSAKLPTEDEVERLRALVQSQYLLHNQREKLFNQQKERDSRPQHSPLPLAGKVRISPIDEETTVSPTPTLNAAFSSPLPTGMETSSTESTKTIRGETPVALPDRTPSYPFPPMRTPRYPSGHRPFTALSPTTAPNNFRRDSYSASRDYMHSESVTPSSILDFNPPESFQTNEDPNFPSPNLYDLSLMLQAEPGLDPWWNTVVQIMREIYKADRVTLAIPADATDIENVPWGQKATFNIFEEDALSLTYLPRGSSFAPSSGGTNETSNSEATNPGTDPNVLYMSPLSATRPSLLSRHSFTTFEDSKRTSPARPEIQRSPAARQPLIARSKSYLGRSETHQNDEAMHDELNAQSLEDHAAYEESKKPSMSWEDHDAATRLTQGRVFPVLQALDYEADPLLDNGGVIRVLERGKVIALTRDFPYVDIQENEPSGGSKGSLKRSQSADISSDIKKGKHPELSRTTSTPGTNKASRHSSRTAMKASMSDRSKVLSSLYAEEEIVEPIRRYEEYEQTPPSPWSQSPAPSPAIRPDPNENPFFVNAQIDEESFNPQSPHDYSNVQSVEAIGIDRSCTVLHIPLYHVLLSKPVQSFRLDAAAMESSRFANRGKSSQEQKASDTAKSQAIEKEKGPPIAILSMLSPLIPYPTNLRHSLQHLAAHLATSFSLCRHYTNLENEIAGLSRKRPNTAGFGAVAPSTRRYLNNRIDAAKGLSYSPAEEELTISLAGSITSPSDFSGISRSNPGSPRGTPSREASKEGYPSIDKHSTDESPVYVAGDGYFSSKARPGLGRLDTGSAASVTRARRSSKDNSPSETRNTVRNPMDDKYVQEQIKSAVDKRENVDSSKPKVQPTAEDSLSEQAIPIAKQVRIETLKDHSSNVEVGETRDPSPPRSTTEGPMSPRHATAKQSTREKGRSEHVHTQLHSYGADFASTFQSIPATTVPPHKLTGSSPPSRSGSITGPIDMPPPSDRLKTLMLDTLPAHLFVALPGTGEIVWVNNRYLTYRGQTVADLYQDPWSSIHPDERDDYLWAWTHAIRTGEQFSIQVRIRRFDGSYRWFYTRAVGGRDTRGVIVQWYGSYMDIHDQHIAEVKAARQEEIEASEAKHRLLANLIPQIIFAATEDEGVTFANEQWLSYTGQKFDDALGLGFMDYVHPEDLAKCRIPIDRGLSPTTKEKIRRSRHFSHSHSQSLPDMTGRPSKSNISPGPTETTVKGMHQALSRTNSSSSESMYELPSADLSELSRSGIVKVTTDSNGRLSYTTEVRLRAKSGEYRWHLVRCVEVDNINFGSGDGSWFGACTDINDHKILETKLKEAMESKSKFLSNMSHEIRTPLIGISGMVSFLQDTVLNEEQLDYTNTIQTSANSLLMIINDILDLSKVDAGMMKLSYEWFHTSSLIEDVNELVSTMAISKRLELNYVVDEDVPDMVKGDRVRIRQVLLNVIGNAIKFTSEGEVFSTCRVYHDINAELAENEIMLEYSILDTGRGFTQEEAELIFKPFSQIDGSSTRQHGGSGLGLVISRQLVELHGGYMTGTAVPGKGSIFKFTAKFGLPTPDDKPDPPLTPMPSRTESEAQAPTTAEVSARAMKSAGGHPHFNQRLLQSPPHINPRTDSSLYSSRGLSPAGQSTTGHSPSSSDPSVSSSHTQVTERSSASSLNHGLTTFREAAKASAPDLSSMKLSLPGRSSSSTTPAGATGLQSRDSTGSLPEPPKHFRPPMYSILVICPQTYSREATKKHIEMTLPKDIPHQITPLGSIAESQKLLSGDDPVIFTHIVLNLSLPEEIIAMMDQIFASPSMPHTSIVILSDPVQRQAVMKMATHYNYDRLAADGRVTFIYKPVKPSRFAVIFDPDKERDLSTDRNRSTAQQQVATQKQNYLDVEKRLGNKGYKILLVEDNLVNQKVLLKFLSKVGIDVDTALDGVEATENVFARAYGYYSLILVSISCASFPPSL
jgi:nitrogen-specific signal transduction histidine kinase